MLWLVVVQSPLNFRYRLYRRQSRREMNRLGCANFGPAQTAFENAERVLYASTPLIAGPSITKDPKMLAEQLETIRQGVDNRVPPDKRAIMHRATADLRASGIMDRVIKVGDPLPLFTLKNASDQAVRSADLLATGPLVLTVFRGSW